MMLVTKNPKPMMVPDNNDINEILTSELCVKKLMTIDPKSIFDMSEKYFDIKLYCEIVRLCMR